MNFKDHFSDRARLYSRYRPHYPAELFKWIASLAETHHLAWDCAAGNGQASVSLAAYFDRVIATDASQKQIAMAEPDERIEYRVARADESGLDDDSADLVTVAQAIHWLDRAAFYAEARRVMKSGAPIVIWAYGDPVIDDAALDQVVHGYNRGTIEKYWMPERDLILKGLRTIEFPFDEIPAPDFTMTHDWTLNELAGYMRTWSGTARYAAETGNSDPVASVEGELKKLWGSGSRRVTWPLHLRAGR